MNELTGLRQLVDGQQQRWLRLQWLRTGGTVAAAALGAFLLAVVLDHCLRLPVAGRLVLGLAVLAAWVWCGRLLWVTVRHRRPSDDEVALAMERRTPGGVENRLINALQIGRQPAALAAPSVAALVHENWEQLKGRALPSSVAALPAVVAASAGALALAMLLASWIWQPESFKTAASRILLPFASIDPLYRTVLVVEPGDVEAVGDVPVRIQIRGERPKELAVLLESSDNRSAILVPVPAGADAVRATIPNVVRSLSYAVRGGDFVSPYYRIEVPPAPRLARVQATLHFPEYVKLPAKSVETTGDLEAVRGTKADVRFLLDHPVESADLVIRSRPADLRAAPVERRVDLHRDAPTEFTAAVTFESDVEYRLETKIAGRSPSPTPWQHLRSLADEAPKTELAGIPASAEIPVESPLLLSVSAADDFGVTRFGAAWRRATQKDAPWTALGEWKVAGERKAANSVELVAESLGLIEGDRLEIAPRAADAFPGRKNEWVAGSVFNVIVAGEGAQLQLLYEQILRSEAELSGLVDSAQKLHQQTDSHVRKLDAGMVIDDGTPPRAKELIDWAAARSKDVEALRETTGRVAREMVPIAGSLRLSVGMLADTEMVRTGRAFDSVATRDDPRGRRTSLTEARATQQRTVASLQQVHEQYVKFRQEWELAHMISFVRMLADRQAGLREQSKQRLDSGIQVSASQCTASARRQSKLSELCGLAGTAFLGMAERSADADNELAEAFNAASESLSAADLKALMAAASKALGAAGWAAALKDQTVAAEKLGEILAKLQEAQSSAAKRILAALEERSQSDLAAQAELEKLKAGSSEDLLDEPDGLKLTDIIHAGQVAQNKGTGEKPETRVNDYLFPNSAIGMLQQPDSGKRQQFEILKLATAPGATPSFPKQSDRQGNKVKPHIQEEFEDLVGDLLEEEDEMKANYETFNLNAAFNINEPGEIGKQGGDLNSTAAAAATGNQKPPTTNVGGASRVGRQGARAFGAAVGNESINRRGRDKVQEGQERAPDQAGTVKETKSDDPQEDTSTGIGGRKVESDDAKFSQNDAGEWSDDMVGRMDKAKETFSIVERQGKGIDAKVAEGMRDLTSKQEQTLERLKSIRKELKNLYLPTEHLDELIQKMQANLHSLSERPTADVYHEQQQTLDQIRGALQVFHQAHSGFQASLPREQFVRGRVLDDPSRPPPGYEDAVRLYYEKLTAR